MVNKRNKIKKISRLQLKKLKLMNLNRTRINTESHIAELPADSQRMSETDTPPQFSETSDGALVELQPVSTKIFDTPEKLLGITGTEEVSQNLPELSHGAHVEFPSVPITPPPYCVADTPEKLLGITGTEEVSQNLPELSHGAHVEFPSVPITPPPYCVADTPEKLLGITGTEEVSQNLPELSHGAHVEFPSVPITPPPYCVADDQEDLPYLVEHERETKTRKEITGRRIVDIVYFFNQLQQQKHEPLFQCDFSCLVLETEKRVGLVSYFNFKCRICMKKFKVCTDDLGCDNRVDINTAAVSGIVPSGIGYSQFEETMSAMDIPIFREKYYAKIQDSMFSEWEATALETMERAAAIEREAAIQEGRVVNGIPVIDVFADGAWCKRSYGNNYKAMSGVAAIVGRKFGEVLFIGVKNKYCLICARAEKRQENPKNHTCYKNYEGSSSGMEATIVCEGFKESINMYGLIYGNIVADGDSATYAKILSSNPYSDYVVSKIECRNHVLRNMCNKLRSLSKDTKYPKAHRKYMTDEKVMSMRKVVTTSIKHNKSNPRDIAIKQIHGDITNSLNHAFGDHRRCKDYCCTKDKEILSSTVAELENSTFWFRLKVILNSVAAKSRSLLEDVDTNAVERFNSIIAKFVGGKRINFASRRSYQARCSAAVVSYNTKRPLYTVHKKILGKSPRGNLKKLEARREQQRKRANAVKRKKNRSKLFVKQNDYGKQVAAPDLSADEYIAASADFMKNLETLVNDRDGIQNRTTQQRESTEWLQIRRLMVTASNFGAIIKRQKNFSALVNNILYKSNISSVASVAHGLKNEKFALQQLSSQENLLIEDCGLFVDQEFPYIGATPDGVVGKDTIIEVKCPVAAYKNGIENAIKNNKVQILKYNKKSNQVTINKNSNWYYQAQGQLRVTGKQRCIFGIWGGEETKMEILYIQKDDEFWKNKMEPKLVNFYNSHILPELVDSRKKRGMPLRGSEKN